jgi:hypothetical protein
MVCETGGAVLRNERCVLVAAPPLGPRGTLCTEAASRHASVQRRGRSHHAGAAVLTRVIVSVVLAVNVPLRNERNELHEHHVVKKVIAC